MRELANEGRNKPKLDAFHPFCFEVAIQIKLILMYFFFSMQYKYVVSKSK